MKKILYTLLSAGAILVANLFASNGTFQVAVESPTPVVTSTEVVTATVEPTAAVLATATPVESGDLYGELYFTLTAPDLSSEPSPDGLPKDISRLVRLPGSCVVGLEACPVPETVQTPFDVSDIFATDSSLMAWSPDGRYGLLVVHPIDELSAGKTKEELDKIQFQSPSEFNINPSSVYVLDTQTDEWREVVRMERKFIYRPFWSPDGQWIAFSVDSSVWGFHASQPDDGIYLARPDGSELRQLSNVDASIHGWIGNSLLLRAMKSLYPSLDYSMEMLTLDGEIKPLFDSARMASYSLAPDGGSLLASDLHGESSGSPAKAVDVLALDGSVIYTFGTFTNYSASIYPIAWSPDGRRAAFANLRRVYVGSLDAQPGLPQGLIGIPPGGPVSEVYIADDSIVQPSFWGLLFSSDNKYLLIQVYDGFTHFVVAALDTGQATSLDILGLGELEQPHLFSWRQ